MSDAPGPDFSDEDLATWIRRHPEAWQYADDESQLSFDDTTIDRIVDDILSGSHAGRLRARSRRRRAIIATSGLAVVATMGAVGVAALVLSGQPAAPEAGAACRAEASADAAAIVLSPGEDPIDGCRGVWATGRFAEYVASAAVPSLVACVDPRGAINVFPGEPNVCADLGWAPLDPEFDAANARIVELQQRLVDDVNSVACAPVGDVVATVERILSDLAMHEWEVAVEGGSEAGVCGKAAVDTDSQFVVVHEF